MVVCLRWLYHHMLSVLHMNISRESWVLRLQLLCSLIMCANNQVHYGLMVLYGYLHITLPHYHADLSESIELLKYLSDIFCLKCVSMIRSVLSIIVHAIYGAVCIQLTHFPYDDCENTCTWSYYHHHVWTVCCCLGLSHETMVCALCLSIFLYIYVSENPHGVQIWPNHNW